MNRAFFKCGFVAVLALLVWIAAVIVMMGNHDTWAGFLSHVLVSSAVTAIGMILLSRHWVKRKSIPSYGSLFAVPSACAFLFCFGSLACEACRYGEWYLLTPGYWAQAKGGYMDLILSFGVMWAFCMFPATAVMLYFRGKHHSAGADVV